MREAYVVKNIKWLREARTLPHHVMIYIETKKGDDIYGKIAAALNKNKRKNKVLSFNYDKF